jgi:glycosidase
MLFLGEQGSLLPRDIRFDPDRAAHLWIGGDGRAHFRVVTEPGFASIHLVRHDGLGTRLDLVAATGRFQVWETAVTADRPFHYSFALTTAGGDPVYRVPAGVGNAVERLDRWEFDPERCRRIEVPDWARGAVIYQIFPERFHDGDPALTPPGAVPWGSEPHWLEFQGGDLTGIAAKADYLAGLGVDLVYVNPILRSPSTHHYDTVDFYEVDPAFGGNDGLRSLVATLHERDIRLIVDASFNHCHPSFFAFADVIANGPDSVYRDWFAVTDWPLRVTVRPDAFAALGWRTSADDYLSHLDQLSAQTGIPIERADDAGPAVEPTYEAWYGVPSLPRIDLTNPGARDYFLDVATHWIREYDLDGWRMDVARYVDFEFWPQFRKAVRSAKTDVYLLAEIMGDAVPWLEGDTFDATMNYTFRQLCLDFLATRSLDGTGFADGLAHMYTRYPDDINHVNQNLIGSHDKPRFLHEAGEDRDALRLATVLQLTLPGAPGLYYGDEVGLTGGEEPASRNAFPWHDEGSWDRTQVQTVRALTRLRREHPALRLGSFRTLWSGPDGMVFVRDLDDEQILVAISRAGPLENPPLQWEIGSAEVLYGDGEISPYGDGAGLSTGADGVLIARLGT